MKLKGLIISTILLIGLSAISNSQQARYFNIKDGKTLFIAVRSELYSIKIE
jgi:hypothetical protein